MLWYLNITSKLEAGRCDSDFLGLILERALCPMFLEMVSVSTFKPASPVIINVDLNVIEVVH